VAAERAGLDFAEMAQTVDADPARFEPEGLHDLAVQQVQPADLLGRLHLRQHDAVEVGPGDVEGPVVEVEVDDLEAIAEIVHRGGELVVEIRAHARGRQLPDGDREAAHSDDNRSGVSCVTISRVRDARSVSRRGSSSFERAKRVASPVERELK